MNFLESFGFVATFFTSFLAILLWFLKSRFDATDKRFDATDKRFDDFKREMHSLITNHVQTQINGLRDEIRRVEEQGRDERKRIEAKLDRLIEHLTNKQ